MSVKTKISTDRRAAFLGELSKIDLKRFNQYGPVTYQDHLYALVRQLRPSIVVETGTRFGVSTMMIRKALIWNAHDGAVPKVAPHIYSCDPMHASQSQATECMDRLLWESIPPESWTFFPEESRKALPKIPDEPIWDMFLHDSDHSYTNMVWELSYAWPRLRSGGLIICDDWETCMHSTKHRAAMEFVEGEEIRESMVLGSALVMRKP